MSKEGQKQTGAEHMQNADLSRRTMLEAIGGRILETGEGYARGELALSETVMQPTRVYHAGAVIALADAVASVAIAGNNYDPQAMIDKPFPYSIQISTNLLDNDPVGPITAESRVVRSGRMVVVDTEVTSSSGKKMALTRSTHLMVDLKKVGPHNADALK